MTEEQLKRDRTTFRRFFTTACNEFDTQKSDPDHSKLHIIFNKILDKSERLFKVDSELSDLIEQSDEDLDTTETYRDRFTEIKTVYENLIRSDNEDKNSSVSSNTSSASHNIKLPKISLREHELIPRTWVAFWGQFRRIHEDQRLDETDKFQYLLASLKPNTKARDLVNSYPPSKENYASVIEHLKSRFGRDDLLIEVYIRDLLTLVTTRSNVKLSALYDQLGTYLRALETLGVTTDKYAAMLYPVVESCLPTDILKAWDRHRLHKEKDSTDTANGRSIKEKLLEELMTFLQKEVEGEEHRAMAESGFTTVSKGKKQSKEIISADLPSAAALVASTENTFTKRNCLFCDKGHKSQECIKPAQMSLEEKRNAVIKRKCCLVCLKPGHTSKTCHSTVKCLVCARRHFVLMCPELPKRELSGKNGISSSLFSAESSTDIIYLKTLLVRVKNRGRTKYVRALLDDGSHRSYIERELANELGLSPSGKEVLSHGLFGGSRTAEATHFCYNICLERLGGKFSCRVSVLDQPKICTNLPRVKDPSLISELSEFGIQFTA